MRRSTPVSARLVAGICLLTLGVVIALYWAIVARGEVILLLSAAAPLFGGIGVLWAWRRDQREK